MQPRDFGGKAIAAAAVRTARPGLAYDESSFTEAVGSGVLAAFTAVARVFHRWFERERERRELATMSPRDFGELGVPFSAIRDEVNRWPWQRCVLGWQAEEPRRPPEPKIDVLQCIVFPFEPLSVPSRSAVWQRPDFSDAA